AMEATRKESARLNKLASDVADQVDGRHRWSRRLLGSPRPANLIGLAFSGGGIRSATLNLGILEGLQELDLLRHFDYISTVSGGGFIGSWLVGSVRRSAHWLGRLTDWSSSIDHLRKYSNYLAPRTGMLSPDTLTIGITWLRNTLLIQLSALVALFFLLTSALATMRIFLVAGGVPGLDFAVLAGAALCVVAAVSLYLEALPTHSRLRDNRFGRTFSVAWYAVLPAWIGATALTSRFWAGAANSKIAAAWPCLQTAHSIADLLRCAWYPWWPLLLFSALGFALLAWQTLQRTKELWTPFITIICTGVLYLELVGIFSIFRSWAAYGDKANSFTFVFGPPLALLAFSACVLLLIGFSSKDTNEAQREWWTRYGTWLFLYGGGFLFVCGVALFGPAALFKSLAWMRSMHHPLIPWTALFGFIGTVVGGLFAGKSSKTAGQGGSTKEQVLEAIARVGGVVFILGSFLLGSTMLYILLFEIFPPDGVAISHPLQVFCRFRWWAIAIAWIVTAFLVWLFSMRFEINIFGFSQFYRNRLVRCYLGATRWMQDARKPNPFMKFDFRDDMKLWRFRTDSPGEDPGRSAECDPYRGPFPLFNCSLNLAGSSDLDLNTRHGASFTLTPLRCGCDRPRVGYAPTYTRHARIADGTREAKFADGVQLGQAVAISGAAVSSNMGYNTSSLVAFLLTMFNVRLGWWFPNPGKEKWNNRGLTSSLVYLLAELLGSADEKRDFINVSDGGHFENLGIYELVRRRCRLIVACDAECDPDLQFGSLGKMIRNCETDFGAEIDLNVNSLRLQENGLSLAHCAVGTIKYCTGEIGRLIYLKASMTGDEDVSIAQYRSQHPSFPHESTAKQFYSEDQFESYRRLGLEMVRASFKGNLPGDDPIIIGERMFDVLTPDALSSEKFLRHAQALNRMWKIFGSNNRLWPFMNELMAHSFNELRPATQQLVRGIPVVLTDEEFSTGLQLIQLMEDVFLDLRLDDYWQHPDYRGWAILFMRWARSPRFRELWSRAHRTFGIRFEYFCSANLGLVRDNPIARV
ncbi:MAG: patatin-like phospholipase family protein, partial [Acidobacteriaceae bacterium]